MKIAVVGSRNFKNREEMYKILDKKHDQIDAIISGGAQGADSLGHEWAKERGKTCIIHYANWHPLNGDYDKGAGFKRNFKIIADADRVYAFWDGKSRGTKHSIDQASKRGKTVVIFTFDPIEQEILNYKIV